MIVLDSSGWIEFFADGMYADEFARYLRVPGRVIVPTVAIYEVYKWIKRERSEEEALDAIATMEKAVVADLTEEIALIAADLSLEHGVAMADAMMLSFARTHSATLISTDSGFEGIDGVRVFSKRNRPDSK